MIIVGLFLIRFGYDYSSIVDEYIDDVIIFVYLIYDIFHALLATEITFIALNLAA
jgi:hypothetical protein